MRECFMRSMRGIGRVCVGTGWVEGGMQGMEELEKAMVTPRFLVFLQSRKKGSNPNGKQGRRRVLGKDDVIPLQVFRNLREEPREELRARGSNVSLLSSPSREVWAEEGQASEG